MLKSTLQTLTREFTCSRQDDRRARRLGSFVSEIIGLNLICVVGTGSQAYIHLAWN